MASEKLSKVTVKIVKVIEWEQPSYTGYGYTTMRRYIMTTEAGETLVWKTSSFLSIDMKNEYGDWMFAKENDTVIINATVKEHTEYNGKPQTEVQRVKAIEIKKGKSKEEILEEKKAEQMKTVTENDIVWQMPYKQYKEHYNDCETVIGSYLVKDGNCFITVIIREGRLKASGVRFQKFDDYRVKGENGMVRCYRAVNAVNAAKRFEKEFPNVDYTTERIPRYTEW